ncbi:MAG: diacylglycerol kinase family protein [Caldilineaceae bacterium]
MRKSSSSTATPALRTTVQDQLAGRNRAFLVGRWFSLRAAVAGARYTIATQPNAWIELAAVVVVSIGGLWLGLARWEWVVLVLIFGLILALEAVNTAVEAVVDLVAPDYHPLAKIAKDAAAGALVFAVLTSIVVAMVIFFPRLWLLLF